MTTLMFPQPIHFPQAELEDNLDLENANLIENWQLCHRIMIWVVSQAGISMDQLCQQLGFQPGSNECNLAIPYLTLGGISMEPSNKISEPTYVVRVAVAMFVSRLLSPPF